MNTKTAARMRRVSARFQRIADACEREIKALCAVKHTKPEDFAAGVALRELADWAKKHAALCGQPFQRDLIEDYPKFQP